MRSQILVIEPDETMQLYLNEVLRTDYEVVLKSDARQAIDWVNAPNLPDAAIITTDLPQITGIDLLSMLRLQFSKEEVPVVMTTSQMLLQEEEECLRCGANEYLSKPVDPVYLMELLRQILGRVPLRKVS